MSGSSSESHDFSVTLRGPSTGLLTRKTHFIRGVRHSSADIALKQGEDRFEVKGCVLSVYKSCFVVNCRWPHTVVKCKFNLINCMELLNCSTFSFFEKTMLRRTNIFSALMDSVSFIFLLLVIAQCVSQGRESVKSL